ncbi:MAG: hypothetical protein ACP5T3_03380 [Candidatus Micrarchaeia archaeon]
MYKLISIPKEFSTEFESHKTAYVFFGRSGGLFVDLYQPIDAAWFPVPIVKHPDGTAIRISRRLAGFIGASETYTLKGHNKYLLRLKFTGAPVWQLQSSVRLGSNGAMLVVFPRYIAHQLGVGGGSPVYWFVRKNRLLLAYEPGFKTVSGPTWALRTVVSMGTYVVVLPPRFARMFAIVPHSRVAWRLVSPKTVEVVPVG